MTSRLLTSSSKTLLRGFSTFRRLGPPPSSLIRLERNQAPLNAAQFKLLQASSPARSPFSTSNYVLSSSKDDNDENDKEDELTMEEWEEGKEKLEKELKELQDKFVADKDKFEQELKRMEEEHRSGATTTVLDMTQQGPVGGSPGVPMTPQVPEHWPIVPVLAVNKHPVFPKFIKIVEVTDERLVILLRRNVKLNQPYAGVFVKKDDQNTEDTVKDPEELYPIGSFVQIVEMQDFGNK